ncbi:hypothetical protein [Burkholderia sp. AU38729]|uniref:hypothetical protein n=1 Tax=Burkholderia sp. AU38729 TaxID=2879633 RepID=UPI001CF44DC2|nr:hypothetical protein [Burkholderia sp. AU38729]MCA8064384.1 hypothetical protein [Burkholderia sp. AU38729]
MGSLSDYRKAVDPRASDGEDMVRVTDGDMSWGDVDEPYYRRAAFHPPIDELEWRYSCAPLTFNRPPAA